MAQDEGYSQLYAKIVQLRLPAPDGKVRLTDAADEETLLRLGRSVVSRENHKTLIDRRPRLFPEEDA